MIISSIRRGLIALSLCFGLSVFFPSVSFALMMNPVEMVEVPMTHIFLPLGFDDNDNVQLVITGILPDLCHQGTFINFKVDQARKTINIDLKSRFRARTGGFCVGISVPFTEVVSIGGLMEGEYTVSVNENRGSGEAPKNKLVISKSQENSTDDYIYAKVSHAEVRAESDDQGNLKNILKITGEKVSDCFVLDKVKFVSNGVDTYAVLPILKQVSEHCNPVSESFVYETEAPSDLKGGPVLYHVRSMDGESVNQVTNISI